MALVMMRLNDAIVENEETNDGCANQFLLDQILNIRRGIVKLVSISLMR